VVPLLHEGDLLLDKLVLGNGRAERLALLRVLQAVLETGADQAGRAAGDGVAPVVERRHRDLEAFVLFAEAVFDRHFDVIEGNPARRASAHAELAVNVATAEA